MMTPHILETGSEWRAADVAGLRGGDVVRGLNGEWVDSPQQLRWYLRDLRPGAEVELAIDRDGESKRIAVTLGDSRKEDDS